MSYGIKIAQSGKSVQDAPIQELVFSSQFPVLKNLVTSKDSITYTHNAVEQDFLIYTHDLGYRPRFSFFSEIYDVFAEMVFLEYYVTVPYVFRSFSGGGALGLFVPYTTDTELRYKVQTGNSESSKEVTLRFGYTIYYDPEDE
jgi:hypothetical protein